MFATHDHLPGHPRQVRHVSISTGWRVNPTARDLIWFEKLHRHGPQNTRFLHSYTERAHPRLSRAVERLKLLARENDSTYGGPTLYKPPQQFTGLFAPRAKYLVYDLNRRGADALKRVGRRFDHTPVTSGGSWKHDYLAACVSASLELATLRDDTYDFLFQDEIVGDDAVNAATKRVEFDVGGDMLRPDRIMGIRHAAKRTALLLALEVDMATEPLESMTTHRRQDAQTQPPPMGRLYRPRPLPATLREGRQHPPPLRIQQRSAHASRDGYARQRPLGLLPVHPFF